MDSASCAQQGVSGGAELFVGDVTRWQSGMSIALRFIPVIDDSSGIVQGLIVDWLSYSVSCTHTAPPILCFAVLAARGATSAC